MTLANATQVHRPERSHVEVSGRAEVYQFLEAAYGTEMRLTNRDRAGDGRLRLVHARIDVGPFAIEEAYLPGDVEVSTDPLNRVVGAWTSSGRVTGHCAGIAGAATAGDIRLVGQPDVPYYAHTQDLYHTVVLMDPGMVAGVAAGLPVSQTPLPIRFASFGPLDAAGAQRWKDTVSFVKDVVLADDALATPLVVGPASRLLAAVTLSTFPNTAIADPTPHDRNDHQPVLLDRAIEFIDANVTGDIGLADIAEAVHVTPRAVQYMFRRHLDTTPLRYLRRLRLRYAHQDLLAAEGSPDTVTAIAARWGFVHMGRFAVIYRQTYGRSPQTTLRGDYAGPRLLGSMSSPVQSEQFMALLLRTLWAYRGLRGDLTRTAAALAVYPSTVRYRLYRIRELTGLHPKDPRTLAALGNIAKPHPRR
jgi:AraC-like DNA-binding protein